MLSHKKQPNLNYLARSPKVSLLVQGYSQDLHVLSFCVGLGFGDIGLTVIGLIGKGFGKRFVELLHPLEVNLTARDNDRTRST